MTGSWARWRTWVSSCRIKRWPIFSAAITFRRLPSGSRPSVGKILSVLTWSYWQRPTFSRWKCWLRGLMTYYVLFFIHLESRKVYVAGMTRHPDQEWMEQMARNVTMEDAGFLIQKRYLVHDRDSKYCTSFREVLEAGGVKPLALPPRSPNLNAYAERWVRVKEECL